MYGERCAEYLFGIKSIVPFRILWVVAVFFGAYGGKEWLNFIWLLADTLIALVLLSPVVFALTKEWLNKQS